MGRYSPTVLPEKNEDLGAALAEAIALYREQRRAREMDEMGKQDRERRMRREDESDAIAREQAQRARVLDAVRLHESGYREGAPPEEDAVAMLEATRGNTTQAMPAAPEPGPAPLGRGNATQGMPATPDPGFMPSPPRPVRPSPIQAAGQRYYALAGVGGFIDTQATPEARRTRREDEVDARDHGQALEIEDRRADREEAQDTRIGERENERDERRAQRERELEQLRQRGQMSLEGLRGRNALRRAEVSASGRGTTATSQDPLDPKTLDARARIVAQQLSAAERVLDDEGAELELDELAGMIPDSTTYKNVAAEIDSLRGVQGQISAARGGDPQARTGIQNSVRWSGYKQAVRRLEQTRQRALSMGLPRDQVDQAYAEDVAALARRHGLAGGQ